MEKFYSGAATFGLMEAKVSLIWNSFVGGILLLVAILIFYNSNKKSKVSSESKEEQTQVANWVAFGFTIFGLLMIGGSYYKYYMASHSETYAAMSGASLVSNSIGTGLQNLTGVNTPGASLVSNGLKNLTGISPLTSIAPAHMSGGYFYTDTEL